MPTNRMRRDAVGGRKAVECVAVEFSRDSYDEVQNMSEEIPVVSEVAQTITDEADGDLILIIKDGGVGFNVGGKIIVKSVREWHRMAILEGFPSLLQSAVRVDARDATPEQLNRGADVYRTLKGYEMERNPNANKFAMPQGYTDLGWQVTSANCEIVAKCREDKHLTKNYDNSLYKFRGTDVITICDICKTVYHIDST